MKRWAMVTLLWATGMAASAQDMRIIAPFSPGGNLDLTARIVAKSMQSYLKHVVTVENKPGAGGMVGASYVAKSPANGRTLLLASPSTIFGGPILTGDKAPYLYQDLTPIGPITYTPVVLVVAAESELHSFQDVVRAAQEKKQLSFAHPGEGTVNQIAILKLAEELKGDFLNVPFKGSIDGLREIMAGRVDVSVAEITVSKQFLDAGKLRAIAIVGPKRLSSYPDIPTLKELGFPSVEANIYTALMAPEKTDQKTIITLNTALKNALNDKATRDAFSNLGVDVLDMSLAEFQRVINRDAARLQELVTKGVVRLP